MKTILIQANNLDTVIDVFIYISTNQGCSKQDVADFCGFSLRQVDYYANACVYLGLLSEDWKKTDLANDIFENNPAEVTERVYAEIISDELMGKIFSRVYTLPNADHSEYAKKMTMELFPGYSDAVYERRSDNIIKWCKRIIGYTKK